jgi:methyl-accepting chemotaxis protein
MWLVVATVFPLLVTTGISEWQARPALIAQASTSMQSDAKTRVQLIDTYFSERLLDAQTLAQVPTVQQFLTTPPSLSPEYQILVTRTLYALIAGSIRDKRYTIWSLFDPQGHLRLSYPKQPQPHGQYLIPPEDMQTVLAGKSFLSAVYYSPNTQKASVDIYAPIVTQSPYSFLGFMRATLNLDYIWNIVNDDRAANGTGSYAFILDENGVRVADTQPLERFTSVAPLPPQIQQRITQEGRYGSTLPVPLLADSTLASKSQSHSSSAIFQFQPAGYSEPFEVIQQATTTVPWTYFVLSPISTVTAVADRQLLITCGVALAVLILAALGGLVAGRRITYPILNAVEQLRNSSQALNELAVRQQGSASEQTWVVDSSQVGLQSVRYYTDATQIAARQLDRISTELAQHWYHMDTQTAQEYLARLVAAAQYIEKAVQHQNTSNQKLTTALKVATQVTEQLARGATSATDAAQQLETVVKQLRYLVGK